MAGAPCALAQSSAGRPPRAQHPGTKRSRLHAAGLTAPIASRNAQQRVRERGQAAHQSIVKCNQAMRIFSGCDHWIRTLPMLEAIILEGLEPDVVSYGTTINSCVKRKQWEESLKFLRKMQSGVVEPNTISCNAALSASVVGEQWKQALHLFASSQQWSLEATIVSHSATIHAHTSVWSWDGAANLLRWMHGVASELNVVACTAALSACEKANRWAASFHLWLETQQRGIEANSFGHSAVIRAGALNGLWAQAQRLLAEMWPRSHLPDVVCYNATRQGLAHARTAVHGSAQWRQLQKYAAGVCGTL